MHLINVQHKDLEILQKLERLGICIKIIHYMYWKETACSWSKNALTVYRKAKREIRHRCCYTHWSGLTCTVKCL